jgi:hypothetical protein
MPAVKWKVMERPGVRARVRRNPGFVAFSSLLGQRIAAGRSVDAFRMLVSLGAPEQLAHKIVETWPGEWKLDKHGLADAGALRLATLIDDIGRYDWPELLKQAVTAAASARAHDEATALG